MGYIFILQYIYLCVSIKGKGLVNNNNDTYPMPTRRPTRGPTRRLGALLAPGRFGPRTCAAKQVDHDGTLGFANIFVFCDCVFGCFPDYLCCVVW